jgi:uncharacterized protein
VSGGQVAALVVCLAVMAAVAAWVHRGPTRWQPLTGPVAAALLLLVGRAAGLSWAQLGLGPGSVVPGLAWGGAAVACVALVYTVGLALPATRGLFRDARHRVGVRTTLHRAGLAVPLGTVVFEEVAFRGVLWGLLEVAHGAAWATGVSAVLFGFWHVLPAVEGARQNSPTGQVGRADLARQVAGTVLFTTVAGVVFGVLRDQSGSLLAPALLHWATNGLGIVAAALAWRWSGQGPDAGE